jgi:hypothetical protein
MRKMGDRFLKLKLKTVDAAWPLELNALLEDQRVNFFKAGE